MIKNYLLVALCNLKHKKIFSAINVLGLAMLVGIAFLIAMPLAIWSISKWLENFAFKTQVSWWVFAISGLGMILIAVGVLSVQTIKAAMANPVKSLRTE